MHGFVIHTTDQKLIIRDYDYIKYDNPGWWQENISLVSSFWEFDSDKPHLMKAILESLSRISRQGLLTVQEVELFCKAIKFDLKQFMAENATPEARFAKVSKQNWDTGSKGPTGGFGAETSFNPHATKSSGD